MKKRKKSKKPSVKSNKPHPWRLCQPGRHWVRTHPLVVPPSKIDPTGHKTIRRGHCADNPTGKDQLYLDEILEISEQKFPQVKERPCSLNLGFGENGNKYDDFIAGWTKYWNDVFQPEIPLDPNVVKALIATESSFKSEKLANKKDQNSARGLMQITNHSRKILGDEKGELKDSFLTVTRKDLNDPSTNICSGIRWLFHKQKLASSRLKKNATWEEAVGEYKCSRRATKKRATEIMDKFKEKLEVLNKCGKP